MRKSKLLLILVMCIVQMDCSKTDVRLLVYTLSHYGKGVANRTENKYYDANSFFYLFFAFFNEN